MDTVTLNKHTLCSMLDLDLFSFVYADDIYDAVNEEAEKNGVCIIDYLFGRFPGEDVSVNNERLLMTKVYIDKLSRAGIII